MSTKLPNFRITITGDTAQELFDNVKSYLSWSAISDIDGAGVGRDNPPRGVEVEQEDFLTQAAAQPNVRTAAVAPIPSATPQASSAPAVEVGDTKGFDSKGFPWDERIHASSGAKTKDGSWRYKRGVEDTQIQAVEQELIAKIKSGSVAEPAVGSLNWPPPASVPVQAAPIAPPPLTPPQPPPPPALPSAHTAETFKNLLVPTLAKLVADGKLTQSYIQQLKDYFKVPEIHMVSPAQAEEMFGMFVKYGLIASA